MIYLDSLFRFSGIGMMLMLSILALRDLSHAHSTRYLLLSCISLSCLYLGYTPDHLQLPPAIKVVVRFMDMPHLVFIWLFALSLFQSDFKFKWYHGVVAVVYCAPILMARLAQYGMVADFPYWAAVLSGVFSLLLMSHLIFSTWSGRAGDLLEKRRQSRVYFVLVIAYITVAAVVAELLLVDAWKAYTYTAKVMIIWPAILWACYWLFEINPQVFKYSKQVKQEVKLGARDLALKQKLEHEMAVNQAYLEPGLSIAVLAKRLGTTQHGLRALINQSLGHENFNTYVNSYRIEAIKKALADRENEHLPILTIALKYGFNSISPFNRAFIASTGQTPSEYRKSCSADL